MPEHHQPQGGGYAPTSDDERTYSTVPLDTEDGERVVQQQAVGADAVEGGGEFPLDAKDPEGPAPGTTDEPSR